MPPRALSVIVDTTSYDTVCGRDGLPVRQCSTASRQSNQSRRQRRWRATKRVFRTRQKANSARNSGGQNAAGRRSHAPAAGERRSGTTPAAARPQPGTDLQIAWLASHARIACRRRIDRRSVRKVLLQIVAAPPHQLHSIPQLNRLRERAVVPPEAVECAQADAK